MKKLIVLFGPEDSGKTTTLKIAYELTKQDNTKETKWFKYYDNQRGHTDFRDVLILKDSNTINESEDKNNQLNNKTQDFQINKKNCDNMIKRIVDFCQTAINNDEDIPDKEDLKQIKIEDWKKDNEPFDIEEEEQPNGNIPDKGKKIAFVLEGDYGFIHHDEKSTYPKQNLYTHLKNVSFCDVIVCACSIIPKKKYQRKKYQPLTCLIQFISEWLMLFNSVHIILIYNGAKISGLNDKYAWIKRNTRNQKWGKLIHRLI